MRCPKFDQTRIGGLIGPRNNPITALGFLVQRLEPSQRVTFGDEFGSKLARSDSVRHSWILYRLAL